MRPHDLRRAAALMLVSAFLFAGMGSTVKVAAAQLPNAQVVFLRNAMGLLALMPWLLRSGADAWRTTKRRDHLIRGIAGVSAMYCFFFAIRHLRLAEAVLLNYSLPLFMPFIERIWLREPIPRRLWKGLVIGFVGVLFVLKPGPGIFQPVALVGLCAGLLGAVAQVGIRRLTATEPAVRIVCYFGVVATLVSTPAALGVWVAPSAPIWLVLALMGILATVAQLFLTAAYGQAPAGQVGPFVYSAVVFAAIADYVLWGRLPDALSGLGAVLIVTAGVITLRSLGRAITQPSSKNARTADSS
jgi:drug/metabolite transporter (DMT)-like permease